MKSMQEVLAEHPDWWWGRTEGKAHCDKCEWSVACDPRAADNAFRAHQAAALWTSEGHTTVTIRYLRNWVKARTEEAS
jgi:hypothetical protein